MLERILLKVLNYPIDKSKVARVLLSCDPYKLCWTPEEQLKFSNHIDSIQNHRRRQQEIHRQHRQVKQRVLSVPQKSPNHPWKQPPARRSSYQKRCRFEPRSVYPHKRRGFSVMLPQPPAPNFTFLNSIQSLLSKKPTAVFDATNCVPI